MAQPPLGRSARRRAAVRRRAGLALLALLPAAALPAARAQAQATPLRGAAELDQLVRGLGATPRVLMIAAHPDDEDTNLIAQLARGARVETAYLSLTRGDGGQNLIGDELGEALGAIRSEELLAARRIDGGRQYFTRAYDFGFSKNAAETFAHWPKDTILGDVVRVVRQFRPHVIVAVFSGTRRDGHGHHEASGILAREAFEAATDTTRFPTPRFGAAWAPAKFYRSARFDRESATLEVPVGGWDPVLGRTAAELAGASRSEHRSQGFGVLERRGPVSTHVRREAVRVAAPGDAAAERSLLDGVDTTWARFAPAVRDTDARAALAALPAAIARAQGTLDLRAPAGAIPALARVRRLLDSLCAPAPGAACATGADAAALDLNRTVRTVRERADAALLAAAGVAVEAEAPRAVAARGSSVPVQLRVYAQGADSVAVGRGAGRLTTIAPGGVWSDSLAVRADSLTQPWWLARPRTGDTFAAGSPQPEASLANGTPTVQLRVRVGGVEVPVEAPVVYRTADAVRGDLRTPLAVAPAVAVTVDRAVQLLPAGRAVERDVRVRLQAAGEGRREVVVRLELPRGLTADSAARTVVLDGPGAQADVAFRVRGELPPGRVTARVVAESGGQRYTTGYQLVDYAHIRPQRLYRPAEVAFEAVDVTVPAGLTIAYVRGVGDNVAPMLAQLGVDVTVLEPAQVAAADLSRFGAVVIGPRAYEAHPVLAAANPQLFAYARRGGTLVVQYQQNEVMRPGVVPYPMTVARPHDRVTLEDAPVTLLEPDAAPLAFPNRIGAADFAGWVQERSLYMPRTFDERYTPLLELHDPDEDESRGALLVAPLGEGIYVYTTLSLFRQLPAGVPGAARLFVNLLAAGRGAAAS